MNEEHQLVFQQCEDDLETAVDAMSQGRTLEASESLTYAIDMWPEDSRGTQRARRCIVDALCLRADCVVDSTGAFAPAMVDLNAALAIQPECSAAHVRCARYMAQSIAAAPKADSTQSTEGQPDAEKTSPEASTVGTAALHVDKALMHCIAALVVGCETEELITLVPLLEELSKNVGRTIGAPPPKPQCAGGELR